MLPTPLWLSSVSQGILALAFAGIGFVNAQGVIVDTTSGRLQGVEDGGVVSFKGVRFAESPINSLRWAPPVAYLADTTTIVNATTFGSSCIQQFYPASSADFAKSLWNNPGDPPVEDEDCLFLNVWTPADSMSGDNAQLKPVVIWLYGGSLIFGTTSVPYYNGSPLSKNQNVVVVTVNYRTNVFGFPSSPDIPAEHNNLGYLDQELAFSWVQSNIRQFGGDPGRVALMGQSAGSESITAALARHTDSSTTPFTAAILLSGALVEVSPLTVPPSIPSYDAFDTFAEGVGCGNSSSGSNGRLACLRNVSAETIKSYINGPDSGSFGFPVVDNITYFPTSISRIKSHQTARVPLLLGNMQDDGSLYTLSETNLTEFLRGSLPISAALVAQWDIGTVETVRSLYPGLNDTEIMPNVYRDVVFGCPTNLWADGYVQNAGVRNVYRYVYGAVFADLEAFTGAGAWHTSELKILFGTYNTSTVTSDEVTWSRTFQTAIGNFIKNPLATRAPASVWPEYVPEDGNTTQPQTLAKLAYHGNVDWDNFVEVVGSDTFDAPCKAFWNRFLDIY